MGPSKKDSEPNKSKVTPVKKKAENIPVKKTLDKKSFTPRKPRRVALISTKRKSPIKNGFTMFELQHDANNLDKNLKTEASFVLDQNLGAEASKDLGLKSANASEDEEASSQPETRRSPRKSKRKLSSSPKPPVTPSKNVTKDSKSEPTAKRRKLPEEAQILESGELKLSFSPEKKPSKNNQSTVKKPETSTSDLSCNEDTPSICEALGLVRSDKSPKISTITTPELNKTPENASVKPVAKV